MKKGNRVQIQKLSPSENPEFPSAAKETYLYGSINKGMSLPVDYTLTGKLVDDIEVGRGVDVARDTRNGVSCLGIFQSSPVTKIEGDLFHTLNSVYRVTPI